MSNFTQAIDAIVARSQANTAGASAEDLMYLAKSLEIIGPSAGAIPVDEAGAQQTARVTAEGDTQVAAVTAAGAAGAANVTAAGAAEAARVQGIYAADTARINDLRNSTRVASLPRMNDWGGHVRNYPVILEGGREIAISGNNSGSSSALLCGYDDADITRSQMLPVSVSPTLDADDFFIEVAEGYFCTFAVTNKGFVYAGGYNNYGQLGHGDTTNRRYLQRVESFVSANRKIASVRVGYDNHWNYGCAWFITTTGEVWGTGYNGEGQLGDGTTTNRTLPVRCGLLSGITGMSVSSSTASVYAWNSAGQLWVWGRNSEGQLGLGNTTNRLTPTESLTGVNKVVSSLGGYWNGSNHSSVSAFAMVLMIDGKIRTTGQNGWGQLGLSDNTNRTTWTEIPGMTGVADIAIVGGGYQTCFSIKSGVLYAWGSNYDGACCTGDTNNRTAPVECVLPSGTQGNIARVTGCGSSRYNTAFFTTTQGKLIAAGANNWGNHGTSVRGFNTTNYANFVDLPSGMSIANIGSVDSSFPESGLSTWLLSTEGELFAAGWNGNGILADSQYRSTNGAFKPVLF